MIGPKRRRPTRAEEATAYELVTARDRGACVRCGDHAPLMSRDHRQERSRQGQTVVENLQLLCGTGTTGCHGWKTQNPAAALEQGYGCPSWADPAEWPARRLVNGIPTWVLYKSDTDWFDWPTGYEQIAATRAQELLAGVGAYTRRLTA